MPYTVGWRRSAENELARIWMRADDPREVSTASDQIDHLLRTSSRARGNDRSGVYHMTVMPLRVVFAVSPDDRKVTVLRVDYLG
jgi:hypothetical protein